METRRFVRHPSQIPIDIKIENNIVINEKSQNVSSGGLCFRSSVEYAPGTLVHIKIPVVKPIFESKGKVVWCSKSEDGSFDIGVMFIEGTDAFRMRMAEQICYIEQYKRDVKENEGRDLTSKEAALEWIYKFADTFPKSED